jgi:hypothetical protein
MAKIATKEHPMQVYAECCGHCFTYDLEIGERDDEPFEDYEFVCWECERTITKLEFLGGEEIIQDTLFRERRY